jgi:hypothetical protein
VKNSHGSPSILPTKLSRFQAIPILCFLLIGLFLRTFSRDERALRCLRRQINPIAAAKLEASQARRCLKLALRDNSLPRSNSVAFSERSGHQMASLARPVSR